MPWATPLFVALLFVAVLSGCGGGEAARQPPSVSAETSTPEATATQEGTAGPVGVGQQETTEGEPFALNFDQPVAMDFKAAYQRRTLIAVQFYGMGQDPFYPQGLEVDDLVSGFMDDLQGEYPTIEFFSYDITSAGDVSGEADLESGQYGTLAAQLNVGYTPFVATMAPSGDGYVILNRFQGYTPQPVLSQALFDLSGIEVADNSSDLEVGLDGVELAESGGGIEYFTVSNTGQDPVDLQGFSLRVLDPDTGEVTTDSPGVAIDEAIETPPGESVSIGRDPDVVGADGNDVAGTFTGGDDVDLREGDQVALLDSGGAVAATFSVG